MKTESERKFTGNISTCWSLHGDVLIRTVGPGVYLQSIQLNFTISFSGYCLP